MFLFGLLVVINFCIVFEFICIIFFISCLIGILIFLFFGDLCITFLIVVTVLDIGFCLVDFFFLYFIFFDEVLLFRLLFDFLFFDSFFLLFLCTCRNMCVRRLFFFLNVVL